MVATSIGLAYGLAAAQKSVSLRYKFHIGERIRYATSNTRDLHILMNGNDTPQRASSKMDIDLKVAKVGADGTATINVSIENSTDPSTNSKTATATINSRGEVKGGSLGNGLQGFNSLPSNPVHVGSSWDSSFEMRGAGNIYVHNKLIRFDFSSGATIAVIHITGTIDMGKLSAMMPVKGAQGSLKIDATTRFNVSAGYLQDETGSGKMDLMIPAQKLRVKGTVTFGMKKA